jgi:hypothetical protein
MANLPQPHPTQDLWGEELNEWLQVGHNPDGTNKGVATIGDLTEHATDQANPHNVTAAQTGAYTTGQTDAAISGATGALAGDLAAHEANTANPHNVTKGQVQLGNVPNVDATQRSNHTGTQAISTVEGLQPALDSKLGKPAQDGVYGQVLTLTHSGQRWVDPPGIVYPSLLLSPDGSFDKAGAVSPTIAGDLSVVPGRYGNAWLFDSGEVLTTSVSGKVSPSAGSIVLRAQLDDLSNNRSLVAIGSYGTVGGEWIGVDLSDSGKVRVRWRSDAGTVYSALTPTAITTSPVAIAVKWTIQTVSIRHGEGSWATITRPTVHSAFSTQEMALGSANTTFRMLGRVETIVSLPIDAPNSEIDRILAIPGPWTMANTAVNMALASQPPATPSGASLMSYFPPNRKVVAGGTTLRTAPGASTTAITTLAAGTDVHSTGQTLTVSTVSYTLVLTALGQGWVPTTALI